MFKTKRMNIYSFNKGAKIREAVREKKTDMIAALILVVLIQAILLGAKQDVDTVSADTKYNKIKVEAINENGNESGTETATREAEKAMADVHADEQDANADGSVADEAQEYKNDDGSGGEETPATDVTTSGANPEVGKGASGEIDPVGHVKLYSANYPNSQLDNAWIDLLYVACSSDVYLVELAAAIATAESGMNAGRSGKVNNMWGIFPKGNRAFDPSREEMATHVCANMSFYRGVESNPALAGKYTGGDSTSNWINIVTSQLNLMRSYK